MLLVLTSILAFSLLLINGILMGKIDKITRDRVTVKYTFLSQVSTAVICAAIIVFNLIFGIGLQ